MDIALLIEWIIKAIVLLMIGVVGFAYLTFYERKALGRIQVRIGPNRAGPGGWLQPVADGVKLIFQRGTDPSQSRSPDFYPGADYHGHPSPGDHGSDTFWRNGIDFWTGNCPISCW